MAATYRVVTLDGQEHGWLDEETVHQWYLQQYLRDRSYVLIWGANEWKPLNQVFDVRQWQQFGAPAGTPLPQPLNQPPLTGAALSSNIAADAGQLGGSAAIPQPPVGQNLGQSGQIPSAAYVQQPYGQPPQYNYYQKPAVFASAVGIGVAAIIGVVALIVTRLIHLLTYYGNDVYIVNRSGRSMAPPDVAATAYMFYGLFVLALIAAGVLYSFWIYRAYKNLRALGHAHTDFTPGWAVGWFFVPVVNLWKPYQVVKEIWEKSSPPAIVGGSALILFWWICFLIMGFANWIGASFVILPLVVVSMIAHVIAAILLIAIIIGVNQRQAARAEAIKENPDQFISSPAQSNPYSLLQ